MNFKILSVLMLPFVLLSCQASLHFGAPIDPSTPRGKVLGLKRQIIRLENSLQNTVKDGKYFNLMSYLQHMINNIEKIKTHVDKKFHLELDAVVDLYSKAIKDYKKTKSYVLVDNKYKSGKKKLRKSYKAIMIDFDKKEVDEKDEKKNNENKKDNKVKK